jgi:hypothetical protein
LNCALIASGIICNVCFAPIVAIAFGIMLARVWQGQIVRGDRTMRIGACLLTLVWTFAAATALEPLREDQDAMISRAVFADGKLWLLTDDVQVSTVTADKGARDSVSLPEPARDLWLENGKPAVLTCGRVKCETWTWQTWPGNGWTDAGTIAAKDDLPLLF